MSRQVTVIIVSWNVRDYLRSCLRSLPAAASEEATRVKIHVIDNGSTDGTVEMLPDEFPAVRLAALRKNVGFARANNHGLEECDTQYALLLNPDTEMHPGSLDRLLEFMEQNSDAGAAGPCLLNTDGSIQKAGDAFPTLAREVLVSPGLRAVRRLDPWRDRLTFQRDTFDQVAEVDGVLGACVLVRRAAWEQVGLLDEQFFMYYEEIDWYRRMRDAGWKVYYVPQAIVTHHGGKSSEQRGLEGSRIYFRSRYLYFRKHHTPLQAALVRALNSFLLTGATLKSCCRRGKLR